MGKSNLETKKHTVSIILKASLLISQLFLLLFTAGLKEKAWGNPSFDEDSGDSLLSLPYIQYAKTENAPNKVGTTLYKKDKVCPGYNIYTSYWHSKAFVNLVDMNNNLIHRWEAIGQRKANTRNAWKTVSPLPNGSIFIMNDGWQLIDVNSRVLATYNIKGRLVHHATCYLDNGGFLGLVENVILVPSHGRKLKILDEAVIQMSPNGQVIKDISLHQLFKSDPAYNKKLEKIYQTSKDPVSDRNRHKYSYFEIFHSNNIENLAWDIPGIAKKGSWLITIRKLDRIIIVDPEKREIIWQWGENIINMPHHATFLKGNKILLFDNGCNKKSSRVIIVDIKSGKIVWQYGQKQGQEFFSFSRGSAQQLPNENVLIADSLHGRAFEVTLTGEIVWEWYADFYPDGKYKGKRRTLYRIQRLPYNFFENIKFNHGKTSR